MENGLRDFTRFHEIYTLSLSNKMGDITIRIMFFSATSRLIFHAYCGGDVGGFFCRQYFHFLSHGIGRWWWWGNKRSLHMHSSSYWNGMARNISPNMQQKSLNCHAIIITFLTEIKWGSDFCMLYCLHTARGGCVLSWCGYVSIKSNNFPSREEAN